MNLVVLMVNGYILTFLPDMPDGLIEFFRGAVILGGVIMLGLGGVAVIERSLSPPEASD